MRKKSKFRIETTWSWWWRLHLAHISCIGMRYCRVRFTYWSRTPSMGSCWDGLSLLGTFLFAPLACVDAVDVAWVDVTGDLVTYWVFGFLTCGDPLIDPYENFRLPLSEPLPFEPFLSKYEYFESIVRRRWVLTKWTGYLEKSLRRPTFTSGVLFTHSKLRTN